MCSVIGKPHERSGVTTGKWVQTHSVTLKLWSAAQKRRVHVVCDEDEQHDKNNQTCSQHSRGDSHEEKPDKRMRLWTSRQDMRPKQHEMTRLLTSSFCFRRSCSAICSDGQSLRRICCRCCSVWLWVPFRKRTLIRLFLGLFSFPPVCFYHVVVHTHPPHRGYSADYQWHVYVWCCQTRAWGWSNPSCCGRWRLLDRLSRPPRELTDGEEKRCR